MILVFRIWLEAVVKNISLIYIFTTKKSLTISNLNLFTPKTYEKATYHNGIKIKIVNDELEYKLLRIPNVPNKEVPQGETDEDNVEVRSWGEKPVFNFTPKNHIELMENLDMVDFEAGTRIAGFRGYILKNDGALLEYALW